MSDVKDIKNIYLSRTKDKDLIAFLQNTSKHTFGCAVREALRLAIRPGYKTDFFKNLELNPEWEADLSKDRISVTVSFKSKNDDDIRNMIASAKSRRCTEMMKLALRFALGPRYVVGNCLKGDTELNDALPGRNMFYIQAPAAKIVYRQADTGTVKKTVKKKEVTEERIPETKTEPANTGFSMPGFNLFGSLEKSGEETANTNTDDDFTDDDILSMLDNM